MKKVLIIGATSAIAQAVARNYAKQGSALYLLARNEAALNRMRDDLMIRGAAEVMTAVLDADDFDHHAEKIETVMKTLGHIDIALIAHGVLGDQKIAEKEVKLTLANINTNALSVISLLTILANYFESQKGGTLAVISSVAGDRGRQSNYIYGAAKGMISIFLQGLRHRLFFSHVQVLDIKPGFVDTPMISHLKKGFLWAQPEKVADDIVRAIKNKKEVLYTPFFWRYIMLIIRSIPECIFKRGKL